GQLYASAHEAAVKMADLALSLPVTASSLSAPIVSWRFETADRARIHQAVLKNRQEIHRRASELPDPGPVAEAIVKGLGEAPQKVQAVLAAWERRQPPKDTIVIKQATPAPQEPRRSGAEAPTAARDPGTASVREPESLPADRPVQKRPIPKDEANILVRD